MKCHFCLAEVSDRIQKGDGFEIGCQAGHWYWIGVVLIGSLDHSFVKGTLQRVGAAVLALNQKGRRPEFRIASDVQRVLDDFEDAEP